MKTLHIIVANKTATYSNRSGDIVCGNSDYQIEFSFDSEWDAYFTKTARFIWNGKYKDVTFPGSVCPVPIVANTDRLEVGVYAEDLCTTTSALIACKRSIRCNTELKSEGTVAVTEVIPAGYVKPSGTLNITENGEYPVTLREKVAVTVVNGTAKPNIEQLTITENGTYQASGDVDGYSPITVYIPTVGVGEWSPETTVYNPGDIVIYMGIYYICIKTTTLGHVMYNPSVATDEWKKINGESGGGGESIVTLSGSYVLGGSGYSSNKNYGLHPYNFTIKEAVSGTVNGSAFAFIEVSGCGGDSCPEQPFTYISFTDSSGNVVASYGSQDIYDSGIFVTVSSDTRVTSLFYSVLTGMMA